MCPFLTPKREAGGRVLSSKGAQSGRRFETHGETKRKTDSNGEIKILKTIIIELSCMDFIVAQVLC